MEILATYQKGLLAATNQSKCSNIGLNKSSQSKSNEIPKIKRSGWTCHACSNFNYETRNKCNRCGKPIKDNVASTSSKTSESNSPNSSLDGLEARSRANSDLNDSNKKKKFIERKGDWMCVKCRNLNFAFRDNCNRCNAIKIGVDKMVEQNMKNMMMLMQYNQMMQWKMRNSSTKMNNNTTNAQVPFMPMTIPMNPLFIKAMQKEGNN
jgi:hypothetical protein